MICDFDVSVFLSTRTLRPLATSSRSECPSFRSEACTPTQTALPSEHELLFLGMRGREYMDGGWRRGLPSPCRLEPWLVFNQGPGSSDCSCPVQPQNQPRCRLSSSSMTSRRVLTSRSPEQTCALFDLIVLSPPPLSSLFDLTDPGAG